MNDLTDRVLNLAQLGGATYADVRLIHEVTETVAVRDQHVEVLMNSESLGFGVRVLVKNAWGFASSATITPDEVDRVTRLALEIAQASAVLSGDPVDLGPPVTSRGSYRTPVKMDPFSVPVEKKVETLLAATTAMRRHPSVKVARGSLVAQRIRKTFANSEGAYVEQELIETGCGITATAVDSNEVQTRSYPNSIGRHQVTAGWEMVEEVDLPGNAERIGAEAVALLSAAPCPSTVTTVILGSAQLALQIHESCGHPIELDRVFGSEAAYAGTSFLTPEKLGTFRYGSEVVNLTADAIRPYGLGTFGWDDEGVPASSTPIVRDGLFVGYLMSRETAARLGLVSNGCMRASGWNRIPLVRMTNVSLEPGTWTFDDLIADTDEGLYMETNRSWSIDDKRLNFQFGTEIAYEIRKGKLGRLIKNATYTGITPQFWAACDAVCNADHWVMWGTPNCGKGQPTQIAHTGHGAAPARFRHVQVGVIQR